MIDFIPFGSERGVVNVRVDATDAADTTFRCDVDVAFLAPSCAPRVSDDVVRGSRFVDSPADSDDSVIDLLGAAIGFGDNTAAEVPENRVSGGNSNVHRLPVDRVQVGRGTNRATIRRHFSDTLACIICTGSFLASVARGVGIVRLFHRGVSLKPVIGPEVPATTAAIV